MKDAFDDHERSKMVNLQSVYMLKAVVSFCKILDK